MIMSSRHKWLCLLGGEWLYRLSWFGRSSRTVPFALPPVGNLCRGTEIDSTVTAVAVAASNAVVVGLLPLC